MEVTQGMAWHLKVESGRLSINQIFIYHCLLSNEVIKTDSAKYKALQTHHCNKMSLRYKTSKAL